MVRWNVDQRSTELTAFVKTFWFHCAGFAESCVVLFSGSLKEPFEFHGRHLDSPSSDREGSNLVSPITDTVIKDPADVLDP